MRLCWLLLACLSCSKADPPVPTPPSAHASAPARPSASAPEPKPPTDVERVVEACRTDIERDRKLSYQNKCECLSGRNTQYKYKDKYENRAHNIRVISDLIDGSVIQGGDEWTFNLHGTGPRPSGSSDAGVGLGLREAPIYFMGIKQPGMGGGTCQVSSTVYEAAMFAHVTITRRTAHTRPSDYTPRGMDATVDYDAIDLILTNPYTFPLYIKAQIAEWAVEEEEPPGTPPMKTLAIFFCTHEDFKPPDLKVKTAWYGKKALPFETIYIDGKYHRGKPKRKQRGKDGLPGSRVWIYYEGEKKIDRLRVRSNYKPVNEVWFKHPDWDAGVDDAGNGQADAADDSGSRSAAEHGDQLDGGQQETD